MTRKPFVALAAALTVLAASAAAIDITKLGVVLKLPGMDEARVTSVDYTTVDGKTLRLNAYRPAGAPLETSLPAVVFINGIGSLTLPDWGQYTGWARLAAASGLVGITYQTFVSSGTPYEDIVRASRAQAGRMLEALRSRAGELGIDPERIAFWSCSANVMTGFPLAMETRPAGLRCAVFYYGDAPGTPRQDLPVLLVRAGLDSYQLNKAMERMAADALRVDVPVEMINVLEGNHGFDLIDDDEDSRAAMRATLEFLKVHLAAGAPARPEKPLTSRGLYARLAAGDTDAAWAAVRGRIAAMRADTSDNPLTYREISTSGLLAIARDLQADGKPDRAMEAFRMAAEAHPESPEPLAAVAEALEAAGRTGEALAAAEKALGLVDGAPSMGADAKAKLRAALMERVARLKGK